MNISRSAEIKKLGIGGGDARSIPLGEKNPQIFWIKERHALIALGSTSYRFYFILLPESRRCKSVLALGEYAAHLFPPEMFQGCVVERENVTMELCPDDTGCWWW